MFYVSIMNIYMEVIILFCKKMMLGMKRKSVPNEEKHTKHRIGIAKITKTLSQKRNFTSE